MIAHVVFALALTAPPVARPVVGGRCASAPFELGKDNVPISSDLSSSVVNTWQFRGASGPALAWLYKTYGGRYYVQFAMQQNRETIKALGIPIRFLNRPGSYSNYSPSPVTPGELVDIENALMTHGIVRLGCFASDLKLK